VLNGIINIKYNENYLHRFDVKIYKYNIGKIQKIQMSDEIIQFSYFKKLYDFGIAFVIGSKCFI